MNSRITSSFSIFLAQLLLISICKATSDVSTGVFKNLSNNLKINSLSSLKSNTSIQDSSKIIRQKLSKEQLVQEANKLLNKDDNNHNVSPSHGSQVHLLLDTSLDYDTGDWQEVLSKKQKWQHKATSRVIKIQKDSSLSVGTIVTEKKRIAQIVKAKITAPISKHMLSLNKKSITPRFNVPSVPNNITSSTINEAKWSEVVRGNLRSQNNQSIQLEKESIKPVVSTVPEKIVLLDEQSTMDYDAGDWQEVLSKKRKWQQKRNFRLLEKKKDAVVPVKKTVTKKRKIITSAKAKISTTSISKKISSLDKKSITYKSRLPSMLPNLDTNNSALVQNDITPPMIGKNKLLKGTDTLEDFCFTSLSENLEVVPNTLVAQKITSNTTTELKISSALKMRSNFSSNLNPDLSSILKYSDSNLNWYTSSELKLDTLAAIQQEEKQIVQQVVSAAKNSVAFIFDFIECTVEPRLYQLDPMEVIGAGNEDHVTPKNVWVSGTVGTVKYNGKNLLKYIGRTNFTTIGADIELANGSIIGGAYNYVTSNFKYKHYNNKSTAHTNVVSIYSQIDLSQKLILQGYLFGAFSNISAKLSTHNQSVKDKFTNSSYSSKLVIVHKLKVNDILLTPRIGFKYSEQNDTSFSLSSAKNRRISGLIGLKTFMRLNINDTIQMIPGLHIENEKFLYNRQHALHTQILSGSRGRKEVSTFKEPSKYHYKIGGTLAIKHGPIEIMGVYDYIVSNNKYFNHQGSLRLKMSF